MDLEQFEKALHQRRHELERLRERMTDPRYFHLVPMYSELYAKREEIIWKILDNIMQSRSK